MFIQRARWGKNDWWRWLLVSGLVALGVIVGAVPVSVVGLYVAQRNGTADQLSEYAESMDPSLLGMDPVLNLALLLLPFICALVALLVGVRALHQRPAASLVAPTGRIDRGRVLWGFGVWIGLAFLLEGLAYAFDPAAYTLQFSGSWFLLLVVALMLLPLQTSAEELIFRGYLWQGVGLLAKVRWVPLLVTTVLFALPHLANPEATEYGYGPALLLYGGAGALLGLLTLLDDRLELALGVHAATNIFAAVFVSYKAAAIQTPALLVANDLNIWLAVGVFYLAAAVFLYLAHGRYGLFHNWRNKLTAPLRFSEEREVIADTLVE